MAEDDIVYSTVTDAVDSFQRALEFGRTWPQDIN